MRLGSSPVHFNIAHDQEPPFRKLKTGGGISDGKSDAVIERVVVGWNSRNQRGGGHDWGSLTVTSPMTQGLGARSTIGRPIWVPSSWPTRAGSGVPFAASLLVQVLTKGTTFLRVKFTITIGVEVFTQLLHPRITNLGSIANAAKRGFAFGLV